MDFAKYGQADLTNMKTYGELQADLLADLKVQLEAQGLELLSTQPNVFCFGAVAATVVPETDTKRFIHVTIADVRKNPDWAANVSLRRMSSERDWKGDEFHYCAWDEVGANAAKYLTPEYDDEIL